jgi:hypothetical protein
MTLITFQDGSPILKDGKIGTEQACCCGGACCLPDGTCSIEYAKQVECEECQSECFEYMTVGEEEECPEGWYGGGGECFRDSLVSSCEECPGECNPDSVGACGEWRLGGCPEQIDCDDCEFSYTVEWNGLSISASSNDPSPGSGLPGSYDEDSRLTDEQGDFLFPDCVTTETRGYVGFLLTGFIVGQNVCGCCEPVLEISSGVPGNSYIWKATVPCGQDAVVLTIVNANAGDPCTNGFQAWPEQTTPPVVTVTKNCENPLP